MNTATPERVECRPDRGGWAAVVLFAAIGFASVYAGRLPPHKPGETLTFGLMGMACLVPALLFAVWLLRARVIADGRGLRWRGLGPWRAASWGEVSDYYEGLTTAKSKKRYVVETRAGRLTLQQDLWTKTKPVRAAIEQRATTAKADAWGVLGTRPQADWPRTFGYVTRENRTRWTGCAFGWAALIALCVLFAPKVSGTFVTLGWGWGLASIGALGLLFIKPILLITLCQSLARDARRRRRQRITVSRAGLAYEDERGHIEASWAEVVNCRTTPATVTRLAGSTVITTRQGSFDFSGTLEDAAVLGEIIKATVMEDSDSARRLRDGEVLGGTAACWSSGREGVGERVYHYRTRTNRALLWFLTAHAALLLLIVGLARLGLASGPPNGAWIVAACGGSIVWSWWRYFAASVWVDDDGLTQHTILGPRRLRWDQVEGFFLSGSDIGKFGNVTGSGTRIRFWVSIADAEELKEEIARRAVHSRNRTWDDARETVRAQTPVRR